ncbi:MAG: AraC family transcriptional regulator [Eubacteriales bacterium]|nr:AraC family transcriptional regulator [Eubacteriales bacterium]
MKSSAPASLQGYLNENYRYFHLRDTAGQERDFHFHEFDKLVLLISGRVDYCVEDRVYALRPWDVLLVKHHTIHKALIDKSEPYERIIIYFDRKYFDRAMPGVQLMECFERAGRGDCLLSAGPEQRQELERTLSLYEASSEDARGGAGAMCDTYIMQLLIQLNRLTAEGTGAEKRGGGTKIEPVLSYINENLARRLSVQELAERAFLSKYHFMRLFKEQTGETVHAYVRQKRLLYAARLIREGIPANKAAADSGFSDYSTFHRAFRESFGISPGELKK